MSDKVRVLVVGDQSKLTDFVPDIEFEFVQVAFDIEEVLEPLSPAPDCVIWVEQDDEETSIEEWAQHLRSMYLTLPVFGLLSEGGDEERSALLVKNGFSNCVGAAVGKEQVSRALFSDFMPAEEYGLNDVLQIYSEDSTIPEFVPKVFSEENIVFTKINDDTISEPIDRIPAAVCVMQDDITKSDVSVEEVGQSLQLLYPKSQIVLVVQSDKKVSVEDLKKNGFTSVYHEGIDNRLIEKVLRDASTLVKGGLSFSPVSVLDLHADISLTYDLYIYMSLRNKYIKFVKKGYPIDEKRLARLKDKSTGKVYVPLHQMPDFYKHCADYLKIINKSGETKTERKKNLQAATREMFYNIFSEAKSFEEGDAALSQVQGIVDQFLVDTAVPELKDKASELFADTGGLYEKAGNISSMVAALSMATGLGEPSELATAGLLMDIGFMKLPAEILEVPFEELSFDNQDLYKKHPDLSLEVINEKKMRISDNVRKYIREHHEYFNGKGYPKGYSGAKISSETALLTLSEIIVERINDEKYVGGPKKAIESIQSELKNDFDKMFVEPKFAAKVIALFWR